MNFLLDQGLPRRTALLLRQSGIDAVHVGEVGLGCAEDGQILEAAQCQGRTVVTFDADFHALLALNAASAPSVIRIRIEGLRSETLSRLISAVATEYSDILVSGAMITVQKRRIRIRILPLRRV